jgi:hypothetical protein
MQTQPDKHQKQPVHRCACGGTVGAEGECSACRAKRLAGQMRSNGRPLEQPVRSDMERRFSSDFSNVRIHADSEAGRAAELVNAAAFTIGQDIVFSGGHFTPSTHAGSNLLAHELAHTVQQRNAIAGPTIKPSSPHAESEARAAAAGASSGRVTTSLSPVPSLSMAKQDPSSPVPPTATPGGTTPSPTTFPADEQQVGMVGRYWLNYARSLDTIYPGWLGVLPACPCTDADAKADPSTWAGPGGCPPDYHPGAVTGYRSVKSYQSNPGTNHGQQCCYDAKGNLITEGAAAGTPDITQAPAGARETLSGVTTDAPGPLSVASHYNTDVLPFDMLGWEIYNRYWKPNNANNCPPNKVP